MATNQDKMPLPLEGVRVLDATHIVAGPLCAMILADLGAEVIKIERPGAGDRARSNSPFITGPAGQKVSARYLSVNRNKKSVTLDLRNATCKKAFENLVRASDILVDNWGPGALQRLGLGYDTLSQLNPALIYASITGYGDSKELRGPYSDWPANNLAVQGMGDWMDITGSPDGPPQKVADNIGDSIPGVWTALGIMMALETRHKTGRGQHVDMAMYECMAMHTLSSMTYYQATGEVTSRDPSKEYNAQLTLRASDGYVALAGSGPGEKWGALWRLIGREDLIEDPRFLGQGIDGNFFVKEYTPVIEEWSQHRPMKEVAIRLIELGFSMGMVQNVADLDHCPQLAARKMLVDCGDGFGGSFRAWRTPLRLTGCVDTPAHTPPSLGADNESILCGIGGLTREELEALREAGRV